MFLQTSTWHNILCAKKKQGEKKGSVSAMLGSKGGVKRVAVVGLGKKEEDAAITPSALEAIGSQVFLNHSIMP